MDNFDMEFIGEIAAYDDSGIEIDREEIYAYAPESPEDLRQFFDAAMGDEVGENDY